MLKIDLESKPGRLSKCCVRGCEDTQSKRHRFPKKNAKLWNKWLEIVNPPNWRTLTPAQIYNRYFICHSHFDEKYYLPGTRRELIIDAIPTIGIPDIKSNIDNTCNTEGDKQLGNIDLISADNGVLNEKHTQDADELNRNNQILKGEKETFNQDKRWVIRLKSIKKVHRKSKSVKIPTCDKNIINIDGKNKLEMIVEPHQVDSANQLSCKGPSTKNIRSSNLRKSQIPPTENNSKIIICKGAKSLRDRENSKIPGNADSVEHKTEANMVEISNDANDLNSFSNTLVGKGFQKANAAYLAGPYTWTVLKESEVYHPPDNMECQKLSQGEREIMIVPIDAIKQNTSMNVAVATPFHVDKSIISSSNQNTNPISNTLASNKGFQKANTECLAGPYNTVLKKSEVPENIEDKKSTQGKREIMMVPIDALKQNMPFLANKSISSSFTQNVNPISMDSFEVNSSKISRSCQAPPLDHNSEAKRKISVPRFVGDFVRSDLDCPNKRYLYWDITQRSIERLRKTNRRYCTQILRYKRQLAALRMKYKNLSEQKFFEKVHSNINKKDAQASFKPSEPLRYFFLKETDLVEYSGNEEFAALNC